MEETLKWVLPILIPLIISISTAWISSRNTIKKAKEETAKEIAAIREETAKEIEIIKAQTEKEVALFQLQQQAKKDDAKNEMVNKLGGQFFAELLASSIKGKSPSEIKTALGDLKKISEDLKSNSGETIDSKEM